MTAQISEKLLFNGDVCSMCNEPLSMYFSLGGTNPVFQSNNTALGRGYIGSWEIIDNRLYMIGLSGNLKDGTEASLEMVFPGFPDRVFAHWYTGKVRLPQGKILDYVHAGYMSTYERDLFLHLEKGVITKTELINNGESQNSGATDGYRIGAMTVFSLQHKNNAGEES